MNEPPSDSDPLHGLNPEALLAAAIPTEGDKVGTPLAPGDLPSMEEIARAFPEFEILGFMGHGGMGAVFRARQPKLDRLVALKVLPKSLAATEGFTERFIREGRVLARLSHPHVVAVHDFGESGGFCYLVMEHVDGVNLRQAMQAGRFTPEQALAVVPSLCDALQFAHGQGVLHRDIKPENILLDSKGRVKIADFGIAKIVGEEGGDAALLTRSGARLGTAPYMAPEQFEQPASVDHRADIYSLGVVLYEMLTGELPLGRFAPPSEKADVGGGMDEVVFRALEKERSRRQQSAEEFKTQVAGVGTASGSCLEGISRPWSPFEYRSRRTLFGMPLLHVVMGRDPQTGRTREARGFFAFGDRARGVVAFGGIARGWLACGGMAIGGVAVGGAGIGLISFGGLAAGLLLALGGLSVGGLSLGGLAVGWHSMGGAAVGWHAIGGKVLANQGMGRHVDAVHVASEIGEMPVLTQWLASIHPYQSVLGYLWVPLAGIMYLVPWWARRRLRAESGGRVHGPDPSWKAVFWFALALTMFSAVFNWVLPSSPKAVLPAGRGPAAAEEAIDEGTAKALDRVADLRFLRLKRNGTDWPWPVWNRDGDPVDDAESMPWIEASSGGDVETENPEDCWLQLWFEHPDFDRYSQLEVRLVSLTGRALEDRDASTCSTAWAASQPAPRLLDFVASPGRVGSLPKEVGLQCRYSIGPWKLGRSVPSDFKGQMAFGKGCHIAAVGTGSDGKAFVAWTRRDDDRQYDAIAILKDGRRLGSGESSRGGVEGEGRVEKVSFAVPLDGIVSFQMRSRAIQTVHLSAVLPPLP